MASRREFQMYGVFLFLRLNSRSYESNTIQSTDRSAHYPSTVSGTPVSTVCPHVIACGGTGIASPVYRNWSLRHLPNTVYDAHPHSGTRRWRKRHQSGATVAGNGRPALSSGQPPVRYPLSKSTNERRSVPYGRSSSLCRHRTWHFTLY